MICILHKYSTHLPYVVILKLVILNTCYIEAVVALKPSLQLLEIAFVCFTCYYQAFHV